MSFPKTSEKELQRGEWVIDITDPSQLNDAIKELAEYSSGKKYFAEYYTEETSEEDLAKIIDHSKTLYPGYDLTVKVMAGTLTQLMLAGEIKRRPDLQPQEPKEPVVDTRPRGADGRFLTEQQIAEQEFQRFVDGHSMVEITARKRSDFTFGEWYRNSFREQVASQSVGDAVTPAGAPKEDVRQSQALIDFVRVYNAEPIANLRPRGGFVSMAGEQVPYETFKALLDRATDASLI
jgi:hypothetical protein